MESVIKNVWEVTIVNNETECANRIIVYETAGTHKAVVVSGRAGGCFISLIEVSRLPCLILALQSMKDKVLWYGFSIVNFILGSLFFQNMTGIFEVCNHSCKTGESVSHLSAIMVGENLEGHNWSQICP